MAQCQTNVRDIDDNMSNPSSAVKVEKQGWRLGVDGCKAGWFYIASSGSDVRFGIVSYAAQLLEIFDDIVEIIIDIPIGLHDIGAQARGCDLLARKALKPRGSTVFPAPVRPCLYAKTYREACDISERLTGKKLSQQAFHIFGKIRDVDELLQQRPELRGIVREAHPELGFCMLNSNLPLLTKKKTAEGLEERLKLIEMHLSAAREIYNNALAKFPRKVLARDDILDAMMCLCIAQAYPDRRRALPELHTADAFSIKMAMHFFTPS